MNQLLKILTGALFIMSISSVTFASLYTIKVNTIEGEPFDMERLKNKTVLFVNVASFCGFTGQYEGLQSLYDMYKDKGLVIVGVPSNDFFQEPRSEKNIASFCRLNYGVTFPLLEKMHVSKRPIHPLYRFLLESNPKVHHKVTWNFNKYLVNAQGDVVAHFGSRVKPLSKTLQQAVLNTINKETSQN